MLTVGLASAIFVGSIAASMALTRRAEMAGVISVLTVAILPAAALCALAGAALLATLRCDESCLDPARDAALDWHRYRDAWQWEAQLVHAGAAVAAAGAAIVSFLLRRTRAGAIALGLGFGFALSWLLWLLPP